MSDTLGSTRTHRGWPGGANGYDFAAMSDATADGLAYHADVAAGTYTPSAN